ncbi:MAG TPA: metalloregulator ArsR/SmtB family transcription factor [Polyangia bacterium]|nr:metalloregulator ArsR/SmtB family transcription factor [Polyangia bacterium]
MSTASERAIAEVFFALGDGTRLSVLNRLGSGGALSATALSEDAQVSRQAVMKHLQVLEEAGLVSSEKRGREVLYELEARRLAEARVFLEGISAAWDRALERLRRLVEEPRSATRPPEPRRHRRR